jgi:hypothetical protein
MKPTWGYALAEFVDAFRRADATERRALAGRASRRGSSALERAYWAAAVESVCSEARMRPPAWVNAPSRFLREPYFAGGLESLKAILIAESPVPFRRRNLFVSENALSRA